MKTSPRPPSQFDRNGRLSLPAIGVWLLLLAIPSYALSQLASRIDWRILLGAPLLASIITLLAYRSDKRRAESGAWRIPESTLHLAELLGGWPGAFLAQRRFRHKISKTSYQIIFWGIVALHEAFALDSLVGWRFTQSAVQFIRSLAA